MVPTADRPDTTNPGFDTPSTRFGKDHTIPLPVDYTVRSSEIDELFASAERAEAELLARNAETKRAHTAIGASSGEVAYIIPRLETFES